MDKKYVLLLVLFLLSITMLIPINYSYAAIKETTLTLDPIHNYYRVGEEIIFTGKLVDSEKYMLSNEEIGVMPSSTIFRTIGTDLTDARGNFRIVVPAELWNGDGKNVSFIAYYGGSDKFKESQSNAIVSEMRKLYTPLGKEFEYETLEEEGYFKQKSAPDDSINPQQGSRDLNEEYCLNNWQQDQIQCVNYVPKKIEQNKASNFIDEIIEIILQIFHNIMPEKVTFPTSPPIPDVSSKPDIPSALDIDTLVEDVEKVTSGNNCANLSPRANLSGCDLHGMDLQGMDFTRTNLSGANLSDANLRGAIFYNANLRGTNFNNADLTGAYLNGADLSRANLNGALYTGEEFAGAKGCRIKYCKS